MMNLDGLNDMQKRAVKRTEGPVLIIAGAGSGKTRVLTHRIAYLIKECEVDPYRILAITFTNKAAAEMRERVENIIDCGSQVWVSTFHSTCVRILRRYIDRLGFGTNFTIYDTDDQKSLIKEACKKLGIDTKMLKERTIMSAISSAKDEMISPDEMEINAGMDYNGKRIAKVYREYQKMLKINNALDFDDLIYKTVELFEKDEEVLNAYQERFRYIMVDEYQDTNNSQFRLISKLAGKYGNLCVVGDDDQSIYRFRGANIGNILNFESTFPGAKVIKLEQNYRSTQTILNAANEVIKHNVGRKDKTLWTANAEGDQINFDMYDDAYQEANGVVESICQKVRDGWNYNDIAILYRTNAQSRLLEEKLLVRNVPYRIYGGLSFYQRKEIKDILAYLKTVNNGVDAQAVKRIINVPKRGIGATTLDRIQQFADNNDMSFWDALCNAKEIPDIGRSLNKIESFVTLILGFKARQEFISIRELTETIIRDTNYMEALAESETKEEVAARQENIDEFINKIVSYEDGFEENQEAIQADVPDGNATGMQAQEKPTLSGFLEEVALIADIDNLSTTNNQVMLMTLHSAKGLEFPIVYLTGLEDGLFPSYMTIMSDDPTEVEEERRLCYVGITRAQKELTISSAKSRMVRGEVQMNKVSRFVKEIPEEHLKVENHGYGFKKDKIAFGGEESEAASGRYNARANAKAALNRYGSGTPSTYGQGTKTVKIGGNPSAGRSPYASTSYGSSSYDSSYGSTSYGTAGASGNQRNAYSATNYGNGDPFGLKRSAAQYGAGDTGKQATNEVRQTVKNVSDASPNKKIGFGKEFPMDIFDLKKPAAQKNEGSNVYDVLGYQVGDQVSHVKFGVGKVCSIESGNKDFTVTVEFNEYGMKKMLAGFAKLKKQ